MHRRGFLAVAAALAAPRARAAAPGLIAEYDRQGIHRTGTAVDRASAEWLAALVRGLGLKPRLEAFEVSRVVPLASFVEAAGKRAEGLPMFDGTFTGPDGISGRVGPAGGDRPIGWLESPPNEGGELAEIRKSGRHKAVLVVTRGGVDGLSLINAPDFTSPYGPPVLQIPRGEGAWLRELSGANAEVRVVAQARRTSVKAFNVTSIRKGTNPKLAPVVVMTPRSGWWQCASERGGGLVCWLEVMRAVARPTRDFVFIASSGHELGHLGLDSFIQKNPTLVKDARAWIHFGANIGAATGPGCTLQSSDEAMQTLALKEIANAGLRVDRRPLGRVPAGEAGNIHRGGGRYVSLLGGNNLFHNPADRWPDAVDPAALGKYAAAFVQVAVSLGQETS